MKGKKKNLTVDSFIIKEEIRTVKLQKDLEF